MFLGDSVGEVLSEKLSNLELLFFRNNLIGKAMLIEVET